MKHIASTTMGLVALAVLSTATIAQKPGADVQVVKEKAPGKAGAASIVTVTAAVESVDEKNRTLVLKGPRGNVFDLAVGPEVKNFAQIKAGDNLVVRYAQALTLELKKGGKALRSRTEDKGAATAQPGERPAAGAARKITVVADVTGVNTKAQTMTLRGPKRSVTIKVQDPEQLKQVKVGDQVEATYVEAAAISIEPVAKPAAK